MLRRRKRGVKVVGGFALISLALLVLLIPFNEGVSTQGLGDDFDVEIEFEFDEICNNGNSTSDEACFTASIIDDSVPKIANSNDDLVQQFLDNIFGTNTIGIETVATVYDLAGNSRTGSSIIPIPFAFEDEDGEFFPDNIQISFFAISPEKVSAINLEGVVEFKLDGVKVSSDRYKLWTSSNVIDKSQIPLVVTKGSLPPSLVDRPETFDFTFTDEGFTDGSTHTFSVIIKEIEGDLNGDDFRWRGEFIAYELEMKVDEQKIVILNSSGEAVKVFKNDSTISTCSRSQYTLEWVATVNRNTVRLNQVVPATTSLELIVQDSEGNQVGKIPKFTTMKTGIPSRAPFSNAVTPVLDCKKIDIQRDQEYTIKINGKEIKKKTPVTQINYSVEYKNIDAVGGSAKIDLNVRCSEWRDISHCVSAPSYQKRPLNAIYEQAVSNFGFDYNTVPCEGAKYKIGAIADRGRFGTTNHEEILSINDLPENIKANCLN